MLVSNTSTLVLLAKTSCLESFIENSPNIVIPGQVEREALFKEHTYYAKLIEKLIKEGKIEVEKVEEKKFKKVLKEFRLDDGEAAAYLLFNKENHKAILTDDKELIKLCKLQKIPFITAMSAVINLNKKGVLTKEEALKKLKQLNEEGRYAPWLYEHFKERVK